MESYDDEHEASNRDAGILPWDRRVLRSMATAHAAQVGVRILRITAAVVAVAGVAGSFMLTLWPEDGFNSGGDNLDPGYVDFDVPNHVEIGQFLTSIFAPLAFVGLLLGASYLVAVYAARLDLDIVLTDDEETRYPLPPPAHRGEQRYSAVPTG